MTGPGLDHRDEHPKDLALAWVRPARVMGDLVVLARVRDGLVRLPDTAPSPDEDAS